MASGGPKPPNLTRYRDVTYRSLVLAADPEFLTDSNRVVEYEMSARTQSTNKRYFYGWYKSRGAYSTALAPPGPTQALEIGSAFVNEQSFFAYDLGPEIPAQALVVTAPMADTNSFAPHTVILITSPGPDQPLVVTAPIASTSTFFAHIVIQDPAHNYWPVQYFARQFFTPQYFGPASSTTPDIPPGTGDYLANQYFTSSYFV